MSTHFPLVFAPMEPIPLYFTLLLAGFILIGSEIILPGGILGLLGALVWLAAAGVGLRSFPAPWDLVSAFSLLAVGLLTFVVWIKYFPKSRIGKSLSLAKSSENYHPSTEVLPLGTAGKVVATLRPAGIALFDGKRMDVVADGEWIEVGQPIKISSIHGNRISVVKV